MATVQKQLHGVSTTRNGSEENKQEILHQPSFLERSRNYFRWENLTVAGREVKGFVVSPILAALITAVISVLLAAVLTISATVYWRLSDENKANHDLLIRLDQRLQDKNERDAERFEEINKRFQNVDALQTVLGRDIAKINAKRGNN